MNRTQGTQVEPHFSSNHTLESPQQRRRPVMMTHGPASLIRLALAFGLVISLGACSSSGSDDPAALAANCDDACTVYMNCSVAVAQEQGIDLPRWMYDEAYAECAGLCQDPGADPEDIATRDCSLSCDPSAGCDAYLGCLDACGVEVLVDPAEDPEEDPGDDPNDEPNDDPGDDPVEEPDENLQAACQTICDIGYDCVPDHLKPLYDMEGCMAGCTDPDLADLPARDCVLNECANPELTCGQFYDCACTTCGAEDVCVELY